MNNLNSRLVKIVVGSSLIGVTLISSSSSGVIPILSLVAIPIVISGIVNWRPIEWCASKLAGFAKPLMSQLKITSHNI